jgi:hypothetical protein
MLIIHPKEKTPALHFMPTLTMDKEGKVHFEIGAANDASQDYSWAEDVNIRS